MISPAWPVTETSGAGGCRTGEARSSIYMRQGQTSIVLMSPLDARSLVGASALSRLIDPICASSEES